MRAVLAVATFLLLAVAACGAEPEPGTPPETAQRGVAAAEPKTQEKRSQPASFYLEGLVRVESPEVGSTSVGYEETAVSVMRWWYGGADRWRLETERTEPPFEADTQTIVSSGSEMWEFQASANAYRRSEAFRMPEGKILLPFLGVRLGPANADSIDEFVAQLAEQMPGSEVAITGEELILGREIKIVSVTVRGTRMSESGERSGTSTIRFSVDPASMFILRMDVAGDSTSQSVSAVLTSLAINTSIPDEIFAFVAPTGAQEVATPPSGGIVTSGSLGGPGITVPDGFLRPAYVPDGYIVTRSGNASAMDGSIASVEIWLTRHAAPGSDGAYIRLQQRKRVDGVPEPLRTGEAVKVGQNEGFLSTDGEITRLAWASGSVVAMLTSNSQARDELLKIAESASQ